MTEFPEISCSRRGRPITINERHLESSSERDYVEVCFFSDLHYGSKFCNISLAEETIKKCLQNNTYVFLGGDLLETNTRYSIGAGVYTQITPQQQVEDIIELLRPLAERNLILGYLEGNHEFRVFKETGINLTQNICNLLKIPYLGSNSWNLWYIGGKSYTVYAVHGVSSSKYKYSKTKTVTDLAHYFQADLIAYGHVHELLHETIERQTIDRKRKVIDNVTQHILVTGHYHMYEGYVAKSCFPPSRMGSPIVRFYKSTKKIEVTL